MRELVELRSWGAFVAMVLWRRGCKCNGGFVLGLLKCLAFSAPEVDWVWGRSPRE